MSHRSESQASSLSPPFGKDSVPLLQNLHLDKSDPQELQPSLRCHRCEEDLLDMSWSSFGSPPCKIPLERNFLWTWSFLNLVFLLLIWWNVTILMIFSTLPKLPGPHGEEHESSQSVQEPLPPSTSRWILRLSGTKEKVRVHSIMTILFRNWPHQCHREQDAVSELVEAELNSPPPEESWTHAPRCRWARL